MNLWNRREVPRPPDYTLEYSKEDLVENGLGTCARSLFEVIQKGKTILNDKEVSQCLQKEVGILTASLYQNGRHRTEKFYRVLRKVEKTCGRWQQLGMAEELARLCQLMPSVIVANRPLRLPSKQMFEYLLVKLLGVYHLMLHLDRVCRESAGLLLAKIKTGHFFSTAMVFLSVVARIRALALDFAGQTAATYDNIYPWVNHLKASKAPCVVDTATLPSPLSYLLQRYCSSLDINQNALAVEKPVSEVSFLDPVTNEEGSRNINSASKDSNAKTEKSSKKVDTRAFSSLTDEDIGECVQQQTKPSKKKEVVKKSKSCLRKGSNTDSDGCSATKAAKKIKIDDQLPLNSSKQKPKKDFMKSDGGKSKNQTISKAVKKTKDMEKHCSPAFVKLFKAVKKQTRKIESVGNLRKFLQSEKKNRQEKVQGRISHLLKEEDWSKFVKYVRKRLENIQALSLDGSETVQHMIGKTRVRIKFWLLFPHLRGQKPENWKTIVGILAG